MKSVSEKEAKDAAAVLDKLKLTFEKLNFDLFPADNTLTVWLTDKHKAVLASLTESLKKQKDLSAEIVSDIATKTEHARTEIKISTTDHDTVIESIDASIKLLQDDAQSKELDRLLLSRSDGKSKFRRLLWFFLVVS